jgi:CHASE3 domain sensor protein
VERSRGRLPAGLLTFIPGLRGRLLLAFVAISLFVVAAAAAGFYVLYEVEQTLNRIIGKSVPVALAARELSRISEKIVAVGPALANAGDWQEIMALTGRASGDLVDMSTILANLRTQNLDPGALNDIADALHQISEHLVPMRLAGLDRITAGEQEQRAIGETLAAFGKFGDSLRQRVADLRTQTFQLRRTMTSAADGPGEQHAALDKFEQRMTVLLALDQVQREAGNSLTLVSRAGNSVNLTEIDNLQAQAQRSMAAIEEQISSLGSVVSMDLRAPIGGLCSAIIGDDSIFSWARRASGAKIESRRLIAEDGEVSGRLKVAAEKLLNVSRGEIDNATIDARAVRDLGREVLFAVASLSLVSSFLIVWLYVGRNIVARLTGLSSCMAAIAGGRRHVIVNTEGTDEVSEMAGRSRFFGRTRSSAMRC